MPISPTSTTKQRQKPCSTCQAGSSTHFAHQQLADLFVVSFQVQPVSHGLSSDLQITDKMELLKAALERSDKAYRRTDAVKHLASLLGLADRPSEVLMCIGRAALLHNDLEAAQQTCLQLISKDCVSAWRLCADVMRAGGDEVGSVDTHTRLLSFAAHYCPARRVHTPSLLFPPAAVSMIQSGSMILHDQNGALWTSSALLLSDMSVCQALLG